ncbi:hypothetical protein NEAUS03_0845 [Nematocida ausubeli]|nr:hypothetical protein NEAUS03_0845 [Nematocida ausubeli]
MNISYNKWGRIFKHAWMNVTNKNRDIGETEKQIVRILSSSNPDRIRLDFKEVTIIIEKCIQSLILALEDMETEESFYLANIVSFNMKIILQDIIDSSKLSSICALPPNRRYSYLVKTLSEKVSYLAELCLYNGKISSNEHALNIHGLLLEKASILYVNTLTIFKKAYWEDTLALLENKFKNCTDFENIPAANEEDFTKLLQHKITVIQMLNELDGYCKRICTSPIDENSLKKKYYMGNIAKVRLLLQRWDDFPFISENIMFLNSIGIMHEILPILQQRKQKNSFSESKALLQWLSRYKETLLGVQRNIHAQKSLEREQSISSEVANRGRISCINDTLYAVNYAYQEVLDEYNRKIWLTVKNVASALLVCFLVIFGGSAAHWALTYGICIDDMQYALYMQFMDTYIETFALFASAFVTNFILCVYYFYEVAPKDIYLSLSLYCLVLIGYILMCFLVGLDPLNLRIFQNAVSLCDVLITFLIISCSLVHAYANCVTTKRSSIRKYSITGITLFAISAMFCVYYVASQKHMHALVAVI